MKKAILTGFEPFGPYKFNPVQDITNKYKKSKLGDIEVEGIVLPCTYYSAFNILSEKIDSICPDIILSTGLASRVLSLRLEAIGRNVMNGKYPDAEGKKPENESIIAGGRSWYETNADNIGLANLLRESKLPIEISIDAEGFVCNSLIYLTSRKISDENLPIKNAFLHTPWTSEYLDKIQLEPGKITIRGQDLEKGIEILLKGLSKSLE